MEEAEIAVFITADAYAADSNRQSVIKNYFEQAYDYIDGYTVSVITPSHHPNPPVEGAFQSFTDDPCSAYGGGNTSYNGLLAWWRDYHACHGLYDAKDVNILVTEANAPGGRGGGDFAVAHSKQISNLTTYPQIRGCSSGLEAVGTVLHEAGHCVGFKHEDGWGYQDAVDPSKYYMSPLLKGYAENYDNGYNSCNDYIDDYNSSYHDKCKETIYSDCNESTNINIK